MKKAGIKAGTVRFQGLINRQFALVLRLQR